MMKINVLNQNHTKFSTRHSYKTTNSVVLRVFYVKLCVIKAQKYKFFGKVRIFQRISFIFVNNFNSCQKLVVSCQKERN